MSDSMYENHRACMRCGKKKKENERKKSPGSDASFIAVTLLVGNKTASAAFAASASQKKRGFGFFSGISTWKWLKGLS